MIYRCCTDLRRDQVRASALNGIDFLEVLDDPSLSLDQRQRTLFVHFVKPLDAAFLAQLAIGVLDQQNRQVAAGGGRPALRVEGGERIRDVRVLAVEPGERPNVVVTRVDQPGDFSAYTLRLVRDGADPRPTPPPPGFDPILAEVEFSFKVACPTPFDCAHQPPCVSVPAPEPEIDYLARDYASFRRLILDRMTTLLPGWRQRNPADLGVTLAELLAYVGDYRSYSLDVIATEAYLGTARRRVSVRRHARLVDYPMHDGCNARAWVQVRVDPGADATPVLLRPLMLIRGRESPVQFLTRLPDQPPRITPGTAEHDAALAAQPEVFEPLFSAGGATLYRAHNEMPFYTWGGRECCLPPGATRATLSGHYPHLGPGDVLIFVERRGPDTGVAEDADPAHRHAVRLTTVRALAEKASAADADAPLADPVTGECVTEIAWHGGDALPFPLCISARTDAEHGLELHEDVSVALGNIVPADHGRTRPPEALGAVPKGTIRVQAPDGDGCRAPSLQVLPARFAPQLKEGPLTQQGTVMVTEAITGARRGRRPRRRVRRPFDDQAAAATFFRWGMGDVVPAVTLRQGTGGAWSPRRDLLASGGSRQEFVAEVDEAGRATIRFGDDSFGERPSEGTAFTATYRTGNGPSGNVGAGALSHIVADEPAIVGVWNPLPARGGCAQEGLDDVRVRAPQAFRTQARAVTAEDYARFAERFPDPERPAVQRAVATLRWTGSWHTVFLTVDRAGGLPVDEPFERDLRAFLEPYRLAGHDLEVDAPRYVPLEVAMTVCVAPDAFRAHVQEALLRVFSSGRQPNGEPGVFHPDRFTFGQTVYLSPIYAAALAVPGVQSVEITRFGRLGASEAQHRAAIDAGRLALGRLEIARLENDPNNRERGTFEVTPEGGR